MAPDNPARAPDPEEDETLQTNHLDFPVVGLGAQAGGLAALELFLGHMPFDTGRAFVVVLHLAPHHKSSADALLQRHTRMPVQANHVHTIPPSQDLCMNCGHLGLQAPTRTRGPHVPRPVLSHPGAGACHARRRHCAVGHRHGRRPRA